jgi:hypothetical protein
MKLVSLIAATCCCLAIANEPKSSAKAVRSDKQPSARPSNVTIGAVDTVGGTTYDSQFNGPEWRTLVNSAGHGMYVVWTYSSTNTSTFPDRNMRCNYYDGSLRQWIYGDQLFMERGLTVFSRRAGFGGIDADTNGIPCISSHAMFGDSARPWVAKAETSSYSDTTITACMYPAIAVGRNGTVHILAATSSYQLTYCRTTSDSWPHWSTPMTGILPSPRYADQNIAASKVSDRVSLTWVKSDSGFAYYMQSTDGGSTWGSPTELAAPAAYGVDTVTVFHLASLFPYFDRHDRLHVVANVSPKVNDTLRTMPSQIWHWSSDNDTPWTRIHIAGCSPANLHGIVGYTATYAGRPSIGEDDKGVLHVAWEQFDSANVESTTSCLRADIFYSKDNGDNGRTWHAGTRITDQGTWSCRFPSAIDYFTDDTFRVAYMMDQQAGFFVLRQGTVSYNPIIVQKVPVGPPGIEASERQLERSPAIATFVRGVLFLRGDREPKAQECVTLLDASGRAVMNLKPGPNDVRTLAPGVYFVREGGVSREQGGAGIRKVVIAR